MGKSSNFFGQPIYGQLIKSLNREKIVEMSRKHGGEKYVKSFDGYTHLLTMLYAVIQRFDSLREIEASMTAEVRKPIDKLPHPLVGSVEECGPYRCTLMPSTLSQYTLPPRWGRLSITRQRLPLSVASRANVAPYKPEPTIRKS